MEYHSMIARSIERLNKNNLNEVIESLAFHFNKCKNKKKASFYLIKAAKKASENYSNHEAIRFFEEALELEEDSLKKLNILSSLGEIYDSIGENEQSI